MGLIAQGAYKWGSVWRLKGLLGKTPQRSISRLQSWWNDMALDWQDDDCGLFQVHVGI